MAVSKFGSMHPDTQTRENIQGETPAAGTAEGHRSSIGPLMDVQPAPQTDPTTDTSGAQGDSQVEPREVVEPEPFDRGFGRRRAIKKSSDPGLTSTTTPDTGRIEKAPSEAAEDEPAIIEERDEISGGDSGAPTIAAAPGPAARDEAPYPTGAAAAEADLSVPIAEDAVSDFVVDPAEQPAPWAGWRRSIDKNRSNRDVTADLAADMPPATPEPPSAPPEQTAEPRGPSAGDITKAVPVAAEPPFSAGTDASDSIDPVAGDGDAAPQRPPVDVNAAIEKAIRKVPILTASDQDGTGRKRKKLTLRLDLPTYQRLRQLCALGNHTQQAILETALLNYLNEFGPDSDEAEDGS